VRRCGPGRATYPASLGQTDCSESTDEVRERFTARAAKLGKPTDWESVQQLIFDEFMDMPTKRVPFPEDVGNLVAFLATDLAASISGANYRIDGGSADAVSA
jgi:NAD(P)-dependent dehydrogenase (short-subunit alcohol dehydrogenase family)